jgi:hypothetical protein
VTPVTIPERTWQSAARAAATSCLGRVSSAMMLFVLAFTWLGFLGWLGALLLAVGAVLGLLALVAFFGGGQDGPGV